MAKVLARKETDEPATFGPAMAALSSDRQRAFVCLFIVEGVAAQAARKAGYGVADSTSETMAKTGYRLLQSEAIQAALAEESRKYLRAAAPAAVRLLHRIIDDDKARDQDRLSAAEKILARSDPIQTAHFLQVQHEHHHRHTMSADEITQRIVALASKVGVNLPPVIDAVAEEVPS